MAVWTAISMTMLLGFAALAIDIGYLYVVRAQLQAAADAAALAGASSYLEEIGLTQNQYALTHLARGRAQRFSLRNISDSQATILEVADILVGRHDFDDPKAPLYLNGRWNAADVIVRCTPGSANGPVSLFFANIFGISESGVIGAARAAFDDRFAGFRPMGDGSALLPFTIHEDVYADLVASGPDNFSYDGEVKPSGDGIPEVRLFPWKWHNAEGPDAAGNFGTLNIGIDNLGASLLELQILNGVTGEQLKSEFGTAELIFTGQDGEPITYSSTGNPGLSTGIKDSVDARMGDIVGFFLHRTTVLNGSNCIYEITNLRFGRVVEVHLVGNPEMRALSIQRAPFTSGSIIVGDYAESTGGLVGRLTLVQ